LQLKLGAIHPGYFLDKYHVNILERFSKAFESLSANGHLSALNADIVSLTRDGLLQVDVLLPKFFLPEHAGIRYT
jgi:oxygen-independent coproporphyrinogen-3 oxidase